uniref:Uncharacterized protein n=1 Tax=Globodera rostochiensis TaxID=31243 RepID=A0A914H7Z1_GLORO
MHVVAVDGEQQSEAGGNIQQEANRDFKFQPRAKRRKWAKLYWMMFNKMKHDLTTQHIGRRKRRLGSYDATIGIWRCDATCSVPQAEVLEKYWNMNPVNGTDNKQFTLPDNVRLYPGQSFADAGITVTGGGGEPEVTIVDVNSVLSTKKCPDSA